MKTVITIIHSDRQDLSSVLNRVSNDISIGYVSSSGSMPSRQLIPVPPPYTSAPYPQGCAPPPYPAQPEPAEFPAEQMSHYDFLIEEE